ncbi:MAG TPA: DNA ligase D [Prolixibacteraceae bacterium]|nr:DNA ligase D [Prolixibacteraceae bacterium]
MSLDLYKKKRDFKSTPEPDSNRKVKKSVLIFVVQRHEASNLHYDFRLQMEGVLKSWAIPKGPSMIAGERRLAVMVEDHPLSYGEFYGQIPEGNYGAGNVEIWDEGIYLPLEETNDPESFLLNQLEEGKLNFVINGNYLKGAFSLVRINNTKKDNEWLLIKKKDTYAMPTFEIEKLQPIKSTTKGNLSVADDVPSNPETNKTDQEEKTIIPPPAIKPMLAKLSSQIINEPSWIYEIKYDGYRLISRIYERTVEMISRNGKSFNSAYKALEKELLQINENVILDGEIVVENQKGLSDFQLLQNYSTTQKGNLKYYVFDILYLNGHLITDFPLVKRKELLDAFFKMYNFENIHNAPYQTGQGKVLFEKVTHMGYEGIIAKSPDGEYFPGIRTDTWLKVKSSMMQEAIICGYTLPQKSRKYFGSLILGLYEGGKLRYIGNCGTGFNETSLKELYTKFEKLTIPDPPFEKVPKLLGPKGKPVWLKPELVCNVKFLEWSQEQIMRTPVFMGLRVDKDAKEVVNESQAEEQERNSSLEQTMVVGGKNVKCTNLTKVYWPDEGYTKGDIISYYLSISKYILPYLKNRPQSLNRHPNGIKSKGFYQKDMDVTQLPSWIKTVRLYSKSNDDYIDYLICNDAATLVYMANLGCIEINPWHSTYLTPDEPSYIVLDLDPGDIAFTEVVNTALAIKEICDEINIPAYCKTSGATGLHIYIPFGAKYTYNEAKTFAQIIATLANHRLPAVTSIERSVSKRKDKVYIDFLQNNIGQTISSAYSIRPRHLATVSTPLDWKEVNYNLTPQLFTIKNIPDRLNAVGDLWAPVLKKGIVLAKALKALDKL